MSLSTGDLDRLSDDIYRDRRISGSVYCGNCGYNLRTLPYAHACPECGNEYNARALSMKGIFLPHEMSVPVGETLGTLVFAAVAFFLVRGAWNPPIPEQLVFAALPAALSVAYAVVACRRFIRLFKLLGISRRIAEQERE